MDAFEKELMDMAFHWRSLLDEGMPSAQERKDFEQWLKADPSHAQAFERADTFWQDTAALMPEEYLDKELLRPTMRERFHAFTQAFVKGMQHCIRPIPALAVTGALIAIIMFATAGPQTSPPVQQLAYATGIAERRSVTLEDGSTITLGAKTSIRIMYDAQERHVIMDNGEAFFSVTKDAARPFSVTSGDVSVTVHGTSFDVRRTPSSAHVAVVEGIVSVAYRTEEDTVTSRETGSTTSHTPARQTSILTAGQQLTVHENTGPAEIEAVHPQAVGAWRENRLVYIDAPLSEIISDVNRYRLRPIEIPDPAIARLRVTATFDSRNTEDMLQTLTEALPVRLQSGPRHVLIVSTN